MKKFQSNAFRGLAGSVSALALVVSAPAYAQDANPEEEEENVDVSDSDASGTEEGAPIVVTGSRIKRDTYSSISPLQVLTTEAEQDAGLFDPTSILQRSESAAGVQIDATFQGFVLDNGPGSTTLDLRGLGADRTLLLINGRRLAPAGVEGAPTAPSLNLLPSTLIERYDLVRTFDAAGLALFTVLGTNIALDRLVVQDARGGRRSFVSRRDRKPV